MHLLLWTCEGITKHILFNQTFSNNTILPFLKFLVSAEMKTFFNKNIDLFMVDGGLIEVD